MKSQCQGSPPALFDIPASVHSLASGGLGRRNAAFRSDDLNPRLAGHNPSVKDLTFVSPLAEHGENVMQVHRSSHLTSAQIFPHDLLQSSQNHGSKGVRDTVLIAGSQDAGMGGGGFGF